MEITHPGTPGNMKQATRGVELLKGALLDAGIYAFQWPQEFDSGIDLIGFATLTNTNEKSAGDATAFVAGFQSKGTDKVFEGHQKRSVEIDTHEAYWKSATLPVFVVNISNDGKAILIEDALSSLNGLALVPFYDKRSKSIPTTTTIGSAATDVRLRMFAHALAPWISLRLRARTLAHEDEHLALDRQSAWSLLDHTSGPHSNIPTPGSWTDVQQYFTLVEYLYKDWTFRQQLFEDLKKRISVGIDEYDWNGDYNFDAAEPSLNPRNTGAFRLLGGMIDLLVRLPSLHSTLTTAPTPNKQTKKAADIHLNTYRQDATSTNFQTYTHAREAHEDPKAAATRNDVDKAIRVIQIIWEGAADALGLSQSEFSKAANDFRGSATGAVGLVTSAVVSGSDLKAALQEVLSPWAEETFDTTHWN